MRHFTVCCLAVSGVCISAVTGIATSTAKPTSAQEAKVSPVALRSASEVLRPERDKGLRPAPTETTSGERNPPDAAAASRPPEKEKEESSQPATPAPDGRGAAELNPSREEFCTLLMSSAEDNALPIGFFANLIWQESRFVRTAVSSAGALGVAQFMPAVAESMGLRNPFDPRQALPASARLLRTLHGQFGNLGLAAAAYNAGPKRVLDWLAKRGRLPQETQHYVLTITGRPAEHWVANPPPPVVFQVPRRVPCFAVEAFAAAVKPGDGPPPRESTPLIRSAEAKAVKIVRAATRQTKEAAARLKAALKEVPILKEPRIKAAIAKRMAPPQPTKVAAKASKQAAKPAKELAKATKEPVKRTREAGLRASSKPFQP